MTNSIGYGNICHHMIKKLNHKMRRLWDKQPLSTLTK